MIRRPPRSTRTDTLFPYTTLFRSRPISAPTSGLGRNGAAPARRPRIFPYQKFGYGTVAEIEGNKLEIDFETTRSEEHTSELQSLMRISYAVFCLKKKTNKIDKSKPLHHINTHNHHNKQLSTL